MVVGVNIDQHHTPTLWMAPGTGANDGVGQYLVTRHNPAGTQGQLNGITARCAGSTIINTLPGGIFTFQLAGLSAVTFGEVVAMQPSTLHDLNRTRDGGRRYRLLLGKGFVKEVVMDLLDVMPARIRVDPFVWTPI